MRLPSDKLTELLISLQLCAPQELVACEKQVRRLCRDLPDFDSVWLDALVQQRILSPWQAEILQSAHPERLRVGEYVLRQPLGKHSVLGHDAGGRRSLVFRRLNHCLQGAGAERSPSRRLQELLESLPQSSRQCVDSLLLPIEVVQGTRSPVDVGSSSDPGVVTDDCGGDPWYAVRPWVAGWSLDELLVRGGRIPWPAVAEIGRDLLAAVTWLESTRLLHGDVVLRNAVLTPHGRTILTDAFVRRVLQPNVVLTESLTLRECEGIAPEQVGTGRTADARSEIYALGCLLWQLLTCRAVVLSADPVSRLMKLRDQDIVDVRQFVPDCPEWMARLILSMTRRSPELRPSSCADVLRQWVAASGSGHSSARALAYEMPDRASRMRPAIPLRNSSAFARPRSAAGALKATAALLVVAGLVLGGTQLGLLPRTLRVGPPSSWLLKAQQPAEADGTGIPTNDQLQQSAEAVLAMEASRQGGATINGGGNRMNPLPAMSADGHIALRPGRLYRATDLKAAGPLLIETVTTGAAGQSGVGVLPDVPAERTATVFVDRGVPWQLTAAQVTLRNVRVQTLDSMAEQEQAGLVAGSVPSSAAVAGNGTSNLLQVSARQLLIESCVLEVRAGQTGAACVSWDRQDVEDSRLVLQDSIFAGAGYGVRMNHPPRHCVLANVVLGTENSGLRCDFSEPADRDWHLQISKVTSRGGQSVLDVVVREAQIPSVSVRMSGGESVLAPGLALIRVAAPTGWPMNQFRAEFRLPETGNATIVPPGIEWALYFDPQLKSFVRLAEQQVLAESLLIAAPEFGSGSAGMPAASLPVQPDSDSSRLSGYELLDFEGPKLNAVMPGIDRTRLPAW